jgi:invasion protein IalB
MKLFLAAVFLIFAGNAQAQNLESKHGDWEVYKSGTTCYMATTPIKEDGNFTRRGQAYALINFKKGASDEINITSGYPYKPNVELDVRVNNKKFGLFVDGEHAWAKDAAADKTIVAAIKDGSEMVVKGVSAKGTYSTDTYSLKGATAAYKRMVEICK